MSGDRYTVASIGARVIVFGLLVSGFFVAWQATPKVLTQFSRKVPENYQYVATEAMKRGNYALAEQVTRKRLAQLYYDFTADYLLAESLAGQRRYNEAADVIKQQMGKVAAARGGKVISSGYDEARSLQSLSMYLWKAGKYFEAGEMARAAVDAGSQLVGTETVEQFRRVEDDDEASLANAKLSLRLRTAEPMRYAVAALEAGGPRARAHSAVVASAWALRVDKDPARAEAILSDTLALLPSEPVIKLALKSLYTQQQRTTEALALATELSQTTGARIVAPGLFSLPNGASVESGKLSLGRTSKAVAQVHTGAYRVESLLMTAAGSRALGLAPILVIKSGDKELTRLYLDSDRVPVIQDLDLWTDGAPKLLTLGFDFINDAYDPYTKADRNVWLSDIMLH